MRTVSIFESVEFLNEGILISTLKSREKILKNYKKLDEYFEEVLNTAIKTHIPKAKEMINMTMRFKSSDVQNQFVKKYNDILNEYNKEITESNNRISRIGFDTCKDFKQAYRLFKYHFILNKSDIKKEDISTSLENFINKYSEDSIFINKLNKSSDEIANMYRDFCKWAEGKECEKIYNSMDDKNKILYGQALQLSLDFVFNRVRDIFNTSNYIFDTVIKNIPKKYKINL